MYFALVRSTPGEEPNPPTGETGKLAPGLTGPAVRQNGPIIKRGVNVGVVQLKEEKSKFILKIITDEGTKQVPVTPETTCLDVLECLKGPGEENSYITELYSGSERVLDQLERPYDILKQKGDDIDQVQYHLKYGRPPLPQKRTKMRDKEKTGDKGEAAKGGKMEDNTQYESQEKVQDHGKVDGNGTIGNSVEIEDNDITGKIGNNVNIEDNGYMERNEKVGDVDYTENSTILEDNVSLENDVVGEGTGKLGDGVDVDNGEAVEDGVRTDVPVSTTHTSGATENMGRRQRARDIGNGGRDVVSESSPGLPGGGYDMTLSELQDMATRQQQQIESQQQILVAKEQRLKFLKQQEEKQVRVASENDRLRRLRDKVEAQEMKLKKLRALRGQVEEHRSHNGNLNFELETIKHLFNEKEKELAMAVAKVEEMTRQLEDIRSGKVKSATSNHSPAAMAELEKLKKELMIRNKLNEQQNSKVSSNRELLLKRKEEVARMDNRIHELQMRLKKKRAQEAELGDKNQINRPNINSKIPSRPVANIAAVEPYIQEPHTDIMVEDIKNSNTGFGKKDPKYKSLPPSSKLSHSDKGTSNKPREPNNNTVDYNRKHLEPDKLDDYTIPLVVTVENNNKSNQNGSSKPSSTIGHHLPPPHSSYNTSHVSDGVPTSGSGMNNVRYGTSVPARTGISHLTPRPFGSTYSTAVVPNRGGVGVPKDQPRFDGQEDIRQAGSGQSSPGSVEGQEGQHKQSPQISPTQLKGHDVPPLPTRSAHTQDKNNIPTSQSQNSARNNNHNNNDAESEQTSISVSKGIQKFSGLIAQNQPIGADRTSAQQAGSGGWSNLNHASALGAVSRNVPTYRYAPKSVIANTYLPKFDHEALEKYQKNVLSLHRDLISGSKQKENVSEDKPDKVKTNNTEVTVTQEETDSLSPLSSQNSPLSSTSTPSPASPSRQTDYTFDFPQTPPHADVASDKVSYKPNTPKNIRRRHSDSDNEEVGKALHKYQINTNKPNLPAQENQLLLLENANGAIEIQATSFSNRIPETSEVLLVDSSGNIVEVTDNSKDTSHDTDESDKQTIINVEVKSDGVKKKTNLKSSNSRKSGNRVSFDPLALLLDSSLEGELELVKRCAKQVENVSASNDEGITALHNAICAGHYEIVTFLVEFGCDVNSPDSDGWTPLHCAASCNNLPMVKFLVEHGACIFATTISDHETAAEKCEEDEDGYDGCSEYLYSIQEKLGIMNNGAVYAVFDYSRDNGDELDMHIGEMFSVLKKGDDQEKEWWWSRLGQQEGYIPRNLLGLTPRVLPMSPHSPEV